MRSTACPWASARDPRTSRRCPRPPAAWDARPPRCGGPRRPSRSFPRATSGGSGPAARPPSCRRLFHDFLQGSDTAFHLHHTVGPQREHAFLHGFLPQLLGRAALEHHAPQRARQRHHLVQPLPPFVPGAAAGMPKALSSSSLYLCSCLQSLQMRRTSRCATMRFTALATLNGSIPMSTIRVTVDGASLVCSVERTRWPVSAALMAIDPVSRSRISPTMMMFGSWRRNALSAAANVIPTSFRTSTWLIPIRLYSTGSSAVRMFTSMVLIRDSAEYSVVVLPEPVGPVTSTIP